MNMIKLASIMAMTRSRFDHEALNALRLANTMLSEAGLDWSDVLKAAEKPGKSLFGKRPVSYGVKSKNFGPVPNYVRGRK